MTGAKQGDSLAQICACGHHFGVHDPLGRCDASVEVARDTYARCQCRQFTADSPSRTKPPEDGHRRDLRTGNIIPEAGVRLRMAQLVVELAKAHDEAGEGDPDMASATFVNGTLVVTLSGQQARDLALWCRVGGIADPERFTGDNWPKPGNADV